MNKIPLSLLFAAGLFFILPACNTAGRGIFAKKTAREKYEDRIEKIETPEAIAWKKQGEKVLLDPLVIPAPYAEQGIFTGDSTDANAFLFTAAPGQKINISLVPVAGDRFTTFVELWDAGNASRLVLLKAADTLLNSIEFSAAQGGHYIVRLQPKLASRGRYYLKIVLNPLLGFPISPSVKSNIGSLWGDPRDGGGRKHEGIDIFAKKGSPVVAVSDGRVSRVSEGGIGGKVIWFNPDNENFSVYYAHLDSQYVEAGQKVTKGQPIGSVGNTGNAKFTPAHLHFGIYTNNGAVNPVGFVQTTKEPATVSGKRLNEWYRIGTKIKVYPSPVKKNALVMTKAARAKTISVSKDFYKVVLENGNKAFVAVTDLDDRMKW